MPRLRWRKSALSDDLKPTRGTLIQGTHGADCLLREMWPAAVTGWEESLGEEQRLLLSNWRGEATLDELASRLGQSRSTVVRKLTLLRADATRQLKEFAL